MFSCHGASEPEVSWSSCGDHAPRPALLTLIGGCVTAMVLPQVFPRVFSMVPSASSLPGGLIFCVCALSSVRFSVFSFVVVSSLVVVVSPV